MDIHQLRTFVAVAREGSITRASERLHLSQPAVSAHIKAIEDSLGLTLFERTPRGMSLTAEGQALLAKAEQTLSAHQELMSEASRIKGGPSGKLRLGAASHSDHEVVGALVTTLAERHPDIEVTLEHASSDETKAALCAGRLDAGFINEGGEREPSLTAVEVSRFAVFVVGPPGLASGPEGPDWGSLAALPWMFPTSGSGCAQAAESLFKQHGFRPKRIIGIDRESVTRALVASGVGVGLLHEREAREAHARGEVVLLGEARPSVRVFFAYLTSRENDPLVRAALSIVRATGSHGA